ncbi:hypothetical protein MPER_08026 [Moniliophthora perniciosa FA553]|nr:hypothetical protein MPER_08026 [Moniliophthora perniciosa FA553]
MRRFSSVFRKAAADWDGDGGPGDVGVVSLDDWRAVCAVLLEGRSPGASAGEDDDDDDDDDENSDAYVSGEDRDVEEEDSDEYIEDLAPNRRRRLRQAKAQNYDDDDDDDFDTNDEPLTARQQQTCLQTFALFFDSVSPEEVSKQRIVIDDIQRVVKLLNEKMKAEEMMEMLETFSSSPDKSVSLGDFEKMMVAAGLV